MKPGIHHHYLRCCHLRLNRVRWALAKGEHVVEPEQAAEDRQEADEDDDVGHGQITPAHDRQVDQMAGDTGTHSDDYCPRRERPRRDACRSAGRTRYGPGVQSS